MADPTTVSDAEFAAAFVRRAVTTERVVAALGSLAKKELRFGPHSAGPASVASLGTVGAARVSARDAHLPVFDVTVPVTLEMSVRLGVESRIAADVEVDLVLTPRTAHPLLLVIDIPPVHAKDVRVEMHGSGLGASVSSVLSAVSGEVRRQVARQVTALVNSDGLRRSRTVDIAARIDGERNPDPPQSWEWIDGERWGALFVRHAVTDGRLRDGFAGFAGRQIEIGPFPGGPGGVATVRATGRVGEPSVRGGAGSFDVTLPVDLDLVVDIARENRYRADVSVLLVAKPYPAEDLHLVVGIDEVAVEDVTVRVESSGTLARLLGRAARIEEQIRGQVARQVNERVRGATGRVVDIGARIDAAGPTRRPRPD